MEHCSPINHYLVLAFNYSRVQRNSNSRLVYLCHDQTKSIIDNKDIFILYRSSHVVTRSRFRFTVILLYSCQKYSRLPTFGQQSINIIASKVARLHSKDLDLLAIQEQKKYQPSSIIEIENPSNSKSAAGSERYISEQGYVWEIFFASLMELLKLPNKASTQEGCFFR